MVWNQETYCKNGVQFAANVREQNTDKMASIKSNAKIWQIGLK